MQQENLLSLSRFKGQSSRKMLIEEEIYWVNNHVINDEGEGEPVQVEEVIAEDYRPRTQLLMQRL